MASYYVRTGSPFYWIRVRKADGSWGGKSSGVRIDTKGSLRTIHQMVGEETSKEVCEAEDGVSALFSRWVPPWMEYKYVKPATLWRCKNAWAHVATFFELRRVVHPAEVTYGLAHEYVRWRLAKKEGEDARRKPVAWNTAIVEVRVLGAVMQEALRRGWVIANPCAKLGLGRRNVSEKRVISRAEEIKIFEELEKRRKLSPWMAESFLVAMRQGCRLMEVAVPMDRIDTEHMVIAFKVKGGGIHAAPLHIGLLPLVERARAEKRKTLVTLPQCPSPRWVKFFKQIGLEGLTFHCTRVTVVTRLCEAGYSESQTMAYVGHSSELVHALYRKMRPKAVAILGSALG